MAAITSPQTKLQLRPVPSGGQMPLLAASPSNVALLRPRTVNHVPSGDTEDPVVSPEDVLTCALFRPRSSLPPVQFKLGVFLREFFIHVFDFLTIPLILCMEGLKGLYNRDYIPTNLIGFVFWVIQVVFAVSVYFFNWVYFTTLPSYVSLIEIVVVDLLVIIRCGTIAAKYAYLPADWFSRLRTQDEKFSILLLGGWRDLPDKFLVEQIRVAEDAAETDLSRYKFTFNEPSVSETASLLPVKPRIVSARDYVFQLWRNVRDSKPGNATLVLALAALHSSIAPIVRYFRYGTAYGEDDRTVTAMLAIMTFVHFCFFFFDLSFLIVGYLMFARKAFAFEQLGEALHDFRPRCPENYIAFLQCRKVIEKFGYSCNARLQIFFGLFSGFTVICLAFLVVEVYTKATLEELDMIAFAMVLWDALVFSLAMVFVTLAGGKQNLQVPKHVHILKDAQVEERFSGDDRSAYLAGTASDAVQASGHVYYAKILGFPAGPVFAKIMATVLGTVVAVILQRFAMMVGGSEMRTGSQ